MPELIPCPFCEVQPYKHSPCDDWYSHPVGDCFLSGVRITPDQFAAWNRRPSPFDDAVMGEG